MSETVCPRCQAELDPAVGVCSSCGASVGLAASENEPAWRQQVRETVERRKKERERKLAKRQEDGRQLSIFPEQPETAPAEEQDSARQRRAEIRARVEEKLAKPRRMPTGPLDAGEVAIPVGSDSALAATAAELDVALGNTPPAIMEDDVSNEPLPAQDAEEIQPELASPGERIAGGLIDLGIVALMLLGLAYLTIRASGLPLGALSSSALAALGVIGTLLAAGYFLFFWGLSGQTLGKLLTGTRVVAFHGRPLGLGRALIRGLSLIGCLLPFGVGLLGLWSNTERQGWHDRAASTKVIRA
jgi:uncharacterized RDD family membrane protein YckC